MDRLLNRYFKVLKKNAFYIRLTKAQLKLSIKKKYVRILTSWWWNVKKKKTWLLDEHVFTRRLLFAIADFLSVSVMISCSSRLLDKAWDHSGAALTPEPQLNRSVAPPFTAGSVCQQEPRSSVNTSVPAKHTLKQSADSRSSPGHLKTKSSSSFSHHWMCSTRVRVAT